MKFVLYLSGASGQAASWHREHDTIAGSVLVPRALESALLERMVGCGVLEEELSPHWKFLQLDENIDDMLSDIVDNGPEDVLHETAVKMRQLIQSECSCGVFHLVRGRG